jgi:asparagine synthase (glutamine-hydrolysing)
MCGICGFTDSSRHNHKNIIDKMTSALHHRGPDDSGTKLIIEGEICVGIGHTRLSIIDLDVTGHQPMEYMHLRIVYNGEIYNYKEIKDELVSLGHSFESQSDTEVILHSFIQWGRSCISKFIGMFAFVLYDIKNHDLLLFRDRAGVKPLYYYILDNLFLFSSELKTFHLHPGFIKEIDNGAVTQYFDQGYISSGKCIFKHCHKVNPGHYVVFNIDSKRISTNKYWDVRDFYKLPEMKISFDDAKAELKSILHSAYNYRMVSDVPVGIFLSGGYDSSSVAAILQSHTNERLRTFTIGFEEGNNEAPYAKEISRILGTDHTELLCSQQMAMDIIPTLPQIFDEPFGDSSAIPTILVSKLASKHVKVALSADGGDELFAGYDHYKNVTRNMRVISNLESLPPIIRKTLFFGAKLFKDLFDERNANKYETMINIFEHTTSFRPSALISSYSRLSSIHRNGLLGGERFEDVQPTLETIEDYSDTVSYALAKDYCTYLPDDILTKVDRSTMSESLEGREPLLDHRIVEFVAQLPIKFKHGLTQKRILKEIVNEYLPKKIMNRPKAGFTIPISKWLKSDLFYLQNEYLNVSAIKNQGILNPDYANNILKRFNSGKLYDDTIVWKILQFQMWAKTWL